MDGVSMAGVSMDGVSMDEVPMDEVSMDTVQLVEFVRQRALAVVATRDDEGHPRPHWSA